MRLMPEEKKPVWWPTTEELAADVKKKLPKVDEAATVIEVGPRVTGDTELTFGDVLQSGLSAFFPEAALAVPDITKDLEAADLKLAEEVAELRRLVPRIKKHLQAAQTNYQAAGRLLLQAKGMLGHGMWGPWLKENFSLTDRTARRYMELAESKSDTMSELKAAKRLKAVPSTMPKLPADLGQSRGALSDGVLRLKLAGWTVDMICSSVRELYAEFVADEEAR